MKQSANGATRRFSPSTSAVLASIGFGLTMVWCMLTSRTNGFTSAALGVEALVNPRFFYLLGIFLLALAFVGAPRALKHADGALRYIMPLVSAFGTACYGLAYRQDFLDSGALAVGGLFTVGVGFFWFLARFNLLLARTQKFSAVVWAVAGALVFKLPVVTAFNMLASPEVQFVTAVVMPVACALLFEGACVAARREAEGRDAALTATRTVYGVPAKPRADAPTSQTFRRNMLVLLAVAAVLLAVIRSVSDLGLWGSVKADDSFVWALFTGAVVPAVVIAAFASFALIRMADFTLTMRFQPALLLVMAGLFVVALQAGAESASLPFLADVIEIDELCAHLLFWAVVATALDALDLPSYRVIGIAEAFFAGASLAWMLLFGSSAIVNNVYVLLATYLVVIVAMYATWLGGRRRADGDSASALDLVPAVAGAGAAPRDEHSADAPLAETVADTCLDMARHYGLSPRETEVFTLLAQGRTRAFIQDELVLSGSTVKTHVNHIYAKMGVHDRQEMMDLIWK